MTWEKGKSGNPKGRPKGAKHKLSEGFLRKLHQDFRENGIEAIKRVREDSPAVYLKMVADLVPKEAHVSKRVTNTVTHVGLSETDAFIERVIGSGEDSAPTEPVPH